jgi:branched-chain amino acid aminotransferase
VTDPGLMMIPVDDHVVHRGDGVFETLKAVEGGLYNLAGHFARLRRSASFIGLGPAPADGVLREIVRQTVRAAGYPDALVRILFTRGPGSMGVSPYDCPEPALYVAAYELPPPFMERHPEGATALPSAIPVKSGGFAQAKICNYLPNMLMKKEAVDQGVHFVFSFDDLDGLAESATENVGIVDAEGWLRAPATASILEGTTMNRVLEFAEGLVRDGALSGVKRNRVSRQDLAEAREILIFGTTTDVTAVVAFERRAVGAGRPGPVFAALSRRLLADIRGNPEMRTLI